MSELLLFLWGSIITLFAGSAVYMLVSTAYHEKEVEDGTTPDFRPGHPEERHTFDGPSTEK
mgnify:CR=1 FL=1